MTTLNDLEKLGLKIIKHNRSVDTIEGKAYAVVTKSFKTEDEIIKYFKDKNQDMVHAFTVMNTVSYGEEVILFKYFNVK